MQGKNQAGNQFSPPIRHSDNSADHVSQAQGADSRQSAGRGATTSAASAGQGARESSILGLMWGGKWTVALCVLLALAVAVAYLKYAPPIYTSTAVLYIQQERPKNAPPALSSRPLDTARLSAHMRMLQSNAVLTAALEAPEVAKAQVLSGVEDQAEALRKMLEVTPGGDGQIVSVSLSARDSQEAATIVNHVVQAYLAHQRRTRWDWEHPLLVNSEADASKQSPQLKEATQSPDPDSAQPKAVAIAGSEQVVADRLKQLADKLTTARLDRAEAESLYRSARQVGDNPSALKQLLTAAGLQTTSDLSTAQSELTSALSRLEDRKQSLSQSLGPNHKRMRSLQARIDQAKARLQRWSGQTASVLRSRLQEHQRATRQRETQIAAAYTKQQQVARTMESLPAQVIDPARSANKPSSPKAARALPIGLVGGLMLGIGVVLVRDFYDHDRLEANQRTREAVLANADDADTGTAQAPMLGVVPETCSPREGEQGVPEWDTTASSIHHIRAVLQVRARNQGVKTFAVTSPRRGSGKTSVAMGLASSMALAGSKTLVVDCDLASRIRTDHANDVGPGKAAKRNGTGERLPSTKAAGLVDVAKRRGYVPGSARQITDTHAATGVAAMIDGHQFSECLIHSSVENLGIMPAGNVRPDHISRMSDVFVQNLLETASAEYDMVLLDTGPVPGSVEALLTCSRAEGVLMVATQGEPRQTFDKALSYLNVVGATLAGTIFNRAGREQARKPAKHPEADHSPDAAFIPKARERPAPSPENYGSGILAAAVFSDRSANDESAQSSAEEEDQTTMGLDADSIVSGIFDRDDESASDHDQTEEHRNGSHEGNEQTISSA